MRKTVFFDRDGVLNTDVGYLHKISDFCWMPGAREALAQLTQRGYTIIVVTNQSGVARGFYTEEDVQSLHAYMAREAEKAGGRIEAFYYCPHLVAGVVPVYTKDCDCRKPKAGLIFKAKKDYPDIDMTTAFMIGDKRSDLEAAANAGIAGYLYTKGRLDDFIDSLLKKRRSDEAI